MHRIEQAERFGRALPEIALVDLERLHAPDIDVREIHRRMPGDDPFGERLAGAARRLDADRVEARGDIEPGDVGRLAEQIAHVGREALGAVEEFPDPDLGQRGQPADRRFQDRLEMVEIVGQFAEFEILGNAADRPGLGVRFEGAEQQLARVLLVVSAVVGVAQHRQGGRKARERLGDDVEMLAGLQRNVDAGAEPRVAATTSPRR